jgi:hypothetical protein
MELVLMFQHRGREHIIKGLGAIVATRSSVHPALKLRGRLGITSILCMLITVVDFVEIIDVSVQEGIKQKEA